MNTDNRPSMDEFFKRNMMMSAARKRFDWNTMFEMAIDPVKVRHFRTHSEDKDRDVCTMCGDLCALKTFERVMGK